MRTLASTGDLRQIQSRIALISPTDTPLWGQMTVHQMLCHLTQAFSYAVGECQAAPFKAFPLPRPIFKCVALYMPFKWPPGVPAPPEIRQKIGEVPPNDFHSDRTLLLAKLDAFSRSTRLAPTHPMWGEMTRAQWLRWGYLHTDHHLRQFGR
jgi:hypothetical protein